MKGVDKTEKYKQYHSKETSILTMCQSRFQQKVSPFPKHSRLCSLFLIYPESMAVFLRKLNSATKCVAEKTIYKRVQRDGGGNIFKCRQIGGVIDEIMSHNYIAKNALYYSNLSSMIIQAVFHLSSSHENTQPSLKKSLALELGSIRN